MEEKYKIDVAVFRYSVIHDFVSGITLDHGEKEKLLMEKCDRKWVIPHSDRTSISRGTIQRWIKLYQESGNNLESLYPSTRNDWGKQRALDEETCLGLVRLRKEMPDVSVPFIVKTMKKRGVIPPNTYLPFITVYRFFHQQNLMRKHTTVEDRRKYEAEMPNDIWQSDVMHGPKLIAGDKRHKTYLIAFIDDHSRLIPYGQFYTSENALSFMHAFEQALLRRGLPRKLYVDNGSAYRSRQLMHTAASLGIALIHARPYKPQGKGKIERFFKTIRSQFLPGFTGKTLQDINQSFERWLTDEYHCRKHSSTRQSPISRFVDNIECIRSAPQNLKDHFRKVARRRVNKDRSVILDRIMYEAPVTLIGKQVELLYHEDERESVEIRYKNKTYGMLNQIDINVNCRVKRDKNNNIAISSKDLTPQSGQIWGMP
ncbi:MAG: DDE-type integrase/transposase/recombinase [Syntrophales bacterium]|nr:DDE-type integrase/transposase/recombinase [Syntrophales bacterium]